MKATELLENQHREARGRARRRREASGRCEEARSGREADPRRRAALTLAEPALPG